MKYDIITIGGATRDVTFLTEEGILIDNHRDVLRQKLLAFEYGAKIRVDRFHSLFGGGAANAAVNFARSGFKVACLARVGADDSGQSIVKNLKACAVSPALLSVDAKAETGLSFILVASGGERIIFTSRAANNGLKISSQDVPVLNSAKWLYLASLSGDWLATMRLIFKAKSPRIAWNPGAAQYQAGLKKLTPFLKQTEVFCINKDEAIELVLSDSRYRGQSPDFLNSVKNLLVVLHAAGPKMVLITGGPDGADVYDGERFYHQAILREKKRVDITGVGDVFNSSFVAGLEITGGDIQKSLYFGAKNTAAKIAYFGAQSGLLDLRKLR